MKIVLASGSPRRRELLEMMGVKELVIQPAQGDEKAEPGLAPGELVCRLSAAKAAEVYEKRNASDEIIIAADTIVWFEGRVFGKPHSEAEAFEMLRALSGHCHEVYTGVTVIAGGKTVSEAECSKVYFRQLTDDMIRAYIKTGEPMDKAGAYGAQGKAAVFVERIDGEFFNVMGLPMCRLGKMLEKQGVSLL